MAIDYVVTVAIPDSVLEYIDSNDYDFHDRFNSAVKNNSGLSIGMGVYTVEFEVITDAVRCENALTDLFADYEKKGIKKYEVLSRVTVYLRKEIEAESQVKAHEIAANLYIDDDVINSINDGAFEYIIDDVSEVK